MQYSKDDKNNLSLSSDQPRVGELTKQFKQEGYQGEYWGRLRDYEDTRFAYWTGQSDDGKKHSNNLPEGEEAFPWENANDSRVYLADELCNEASAIQAEAFWKADLRVVPVGTDDITEANNATKFLNWLKKSKMVSTLPDEVDLAAQYTNTAGWSALDISWDREISFRTQPIKMEKLVEAANALADTGDEDLGEYLNAMRVYAETVATPESEETAIELTKILYSEQIKIEYPEFADEISPLSTKAARKIVRDLRDKEEALLKVPYLSKNEPCITARKAFRDVVLPYEATRMDGNIAVFVRTYMTEDEIRANVLAENWNKTWAELALKTKGRETVWHSAYDSEKNPTYLWKWEDRRNELVEVVYAYKGGVDKDGVRSVWQTVFSPHITSEAGDKNEIAATHVDLGYPCFPIVEVTRERVDRSIASSRGIPELVITDQREEKVERDALADNASLSVLPPALIPRGAMGKKLQFGPATQNTYKPGSKPEFMKVPTNGASLAIGHIELIDKRVSRRFGRFSPDIHPAHSQLLMGPPIRRFLSAWAKAFKVAYMMCLKYAPEMIERVTGSRPKAADSLDMGDYDFIFKFDSANLNPDLITQKIKAFRELADNDKSGTIIQDKLTSILARMVDPDFADELVEEQGSASEALFRRVQDDLVQMFNGNEVIYSDASNDPTAQSKGQFATQIISRNPKYIQALDPKVLAEIIPQAQNQTQPGQGEPDPIFTLYVKKYFENIQQGIAQQQNKQTGRTGVK